MPYNQNSTVDSILQGFQARIATLEAGGGVTPVPAPVFTSQPSIAGTPQVGQVLTGMDGTITNGTVVSRRWLLAGAAVSTAQMYAATAAGSLVYEVTATGPGGTTVATSGAVTVTEASTTPVAKFGQVGFNTIIDNGQGASSLLFLNRMKSSSNNGFWDGEPPLSAYGYPTALPAGKNEIGTYLSMRRPSSGKMRYVVRHNGSADFAWHFALIDGFTIVDNSNPNRVIIDVEALNGEQYCRPLFVWAGATVVPDYRPGNPISSRDGIAVYELALEGDYLAGKQFHPTAVATYATFGGIRSMDLQKTNSSLVATVADRTPVGNVSYGPSGWGTPLEVIIDLCNEAKIPLWVNYPHGGDAGYMTWFLTTLRDRMDPALPIYLEWSNEAGWNGDFGGQFTKCVQTGQAAGLDANGGYGILAGRLMIRAGEIFGAQLGRVQRVFARQGGVAQTYVNAAAGVETLGHKVADLFDGAAFGFYTDGGIQALAGTISNTDLPQSQRDAAKAALMNEVAIYEATGTNMSNRTVRQELVDQVRSGGGGVNGKGVPGWPDSSLLTHIPINATYVKSFCIAQGLKHMWGYEGQEFHCSLSVLGPIDGNRANEMMENLHNDPRIAGTTPGTFVYDKFKIMRDLGMGMHMILTDFGPRDQYGSWRTKEHIFSADTRLWTTYQWLQNNGPSIAFDFNVIGTLNIATGANSERIITTFGGNSPVGPLSISGTLPAGMTYNGRQLSGTPTVAGDYPLTFTATDATGRTISTTMTFKVKALKTYTDYALVIARTADQPTGRSVYPTMFEVRLKDGGGAEIPVTWTGEAQGNYPTTNLNDNDLGTQWYGNIYEPDSPHPPLFAHVTGAPKGFMSMTIYSEGIRAPGDFQLRGYNGTPPADGSGGDLLLDVAGLQPSNWARDPGYTLIPLTFSLS